MGWTRCVLQPAFRVQEMLAVKAALAWKSRPAVSTSADDASLPSTAVEVSLRGLCCCFFQLGRLYLCPEAMESSLLLGRQGIHWGPEPLVAEAARLFQDSFSDPLTTN